MTNKPTIAASFLPLQKDDEFLLEFLFELFEGILSLYYEYLYS
jgi:hypothetical protein